MDNHRRVTMPPSLTAKAVGNIDAAMVRRRGGCAAVEAVEACKQDDVVAEAPVSPTSPTSPTTAVVRRLRKAQPNYAVVHSVSLRDGIESALPRSNSNPDLLRPSNSGANKMAAERFDTAPVPANSRILVRRSTLPADVSAMARSSSLVSFRDFQGGLPPKLQEGETIRVLDPCEVRERNRKAVEYFKTAKAINRKARTIEDTETLLADARHRLFLQELDEAHRQSLNEPQKSQSGRTKNPLIRSKEEPGARGNGAPLAAKRPEQQAVAPPEKRMTLAEKFGYGVKTTQGPPDRFATVAVVATATVKMRKKSVMIEVAAGNNSLMERLHKRRATIQ